MEDKIVYAYVVGDILHVGHILHLENSKKLGDKLIVGILTDKAVMEKKNKPTIPFTERMKMVQALSCVDVVVPQDTYSPIDNVIDIQPDILMESSSHNEGDIYETQKICDFHDIKIIKMPYYPLQSSTEIKEKIKDAR